MKDLTPLPIPIRALSFVKKYYIHKGKIMKLTLSLETDYWCIHDSRGSDTANWFWWAAKRHLMFRSGEREVDDWRKGSDNFDDFFEIKNFKVPPKEIPRIPRKYLKKYYYFRISRIASIAICAAQQEDYLYMFTLCKEYNHVIPISMRDSFFQERDNKYNGYTREEIEEMLSRTRADMPREVYEKYFPRRPLAKVYQFQEAANKQN